MSLSPTAGSKPDDAHPDARASEIPGRFIEIYRLLLTFFGPQRWWPADSPFEVAIGAILTQNTNWRNVQRAIDNLRAADALTVRGISRLTENQLARLILPSGFYAVKASRLKNYLSYILDDYGGDFFDSLSGNLTDKRSELLSVSGIGPETADSILLYAGGHPTFVVDTYTKRVMFRHALAPADAGYEKVRSLFMENLPADASLFNEFHALLVAVGKQFCRPKEPRCAGCPLAILYDGGPVCV